MTGSYYTMMLNYKKHTQKQSIAYGDALDEALCYGWIDSLIRKIDEDRYARLFTRRINYARWSAKNITRAKQLLESGRMAEPGIAAMHPRLRNQLEQKSESLGKERHTEMPGVLRTALDKEPLALLHFNRMFPSSRRNYILWISQAKRTETKERRDEEAISLLKENRKPGLK